MATYLKWPLQVGPDGRFVTTESPSEVWMNRMSQLLCSRMGERVMREDYGTTVPAAIFENALDNPDDAVRRAVRKWLPYVTVNSVDVLQFEAEYQVTVTFTTPEREMLTATVGVAVPGEGVQ